jgi:hypothetical protein
VKTALALVCALGCACATRAPTPRPVGSPPSATAPAAYALVVSFGSVCCGTDAAAARALDAATARYPEAALGLSRGSWGKEGEYDECFTLAGLSPDERTAFIAEVRARVVADTVEIRADSACRDDRR